MFFTENLFHVSWNLFYFTWCYAFPSINPPSYPNTNKYKSRQLTRLKRLKQKINKAWTKCDIISNVKCNIGSLTGSLFTYFYKYTFRYFYFYKWTFSRADMSRNSQTQGVAWILYVTCILGMHHHIFTLKICLVEYF